MAEQFEITDEMREAIGVESPPWIYEVTTTSVRAFARGVGYTDPVYFDVEAAQKAGYSSTDEFVTHVLDRAVSDLEEVGGTNDEVEKQLRGLGYLE